jgi:hypothetical protein
VILRPGLLEGVRASVVGAGPLGEAVAARMTELGATADEPAGVLVWDGAAVSGVPAVLDEAWDAIRAALEDDLLIVLLAPPPGDAHAEAARAGLETMARVLSIEWSGRGIRPVTITPSRTTSPAEIAELVAFLASPAGAYFSGCRFDLGAAGD